MVKRKAYKRRKTPVKRKAVKRKPVKARKKPLFKKGAFGRITKALYSKGKDTVKKYKRKKRITAIKEHAKVSHKRIKALVFLKRIKKRDKSTVAGGYSSRGYHGKGISRVGTKYKGLSVVGRKEPQPLKSIRGAVRFNKKKK